MILTSAQQCLVDRLAAGEVLRRSVWSGFYFGTDFYFGTERAHSGTVNALIRRAVIVKGPRDTWVLKTAQTSKDRTNINHE